VPDAEVVFGVIMGTGVGGGLVVHNRVINGRQGIAGEWGHNFLHASGGPCYCGRTGCVETVLAGPALERYYAGQSGTSLRLPTVVERYRQGGDPHAEATIRRLIDFFGRAIAVVINIADPDAIVIGGGVGNIDLLYTEGVEAVRKHVFNDRPDTVFLKPLLGDSAGVFGAAMLVGAIKELRVREFESQRVGASLRSTHKLVYANSPTLYSFYWLCRTPFAPASFRPIPPARNRGPGEPARC
jgi:predicted NBD/HSP70 family sugar kinase